MVRSAVLVPSRGRATSESSSPATNLQPGNRRACAMDSRSTDAHRWVLRPRCSAITKCFRRRQTVSDCATPGRERCHFRRRPLMPERPLDVISAGLAASPAARCAIITPVGIGGVLVRFRRHSGIAIATVPERWYCTPAAARLSIDRRQHLSVGRRGNARLIGMTEDVNRSTNASVNRATLQGELAHQPGHNGTPYTTRSAPAFCSRVRRQHRCRCQPSLPPTADADHRQVHRDRIHHRDPIPMLPRSTSGLSSSNGSRSSRTPVSRKDRRYRGVTDDRKVVHRLSIVQSWQYC